MADLYFKEESYQIMGACFEVYNGMGPGFLEPVYHECLGLELQARKIPFRSKSVVQITYKSQTLTQEYVPDFICYDGIILELKSLRQICKEHRAQLHNYLKATKFQLGILVNFGRPDVLEYERI